MEALGIITFFFVSAAVSDWMTIHWHRAREAGDITVLWGLSATLEAASWAPVLVAVSYGTRLAWACAVFSCAGAALGTWKGSRCDG